jgi:hypothetical protein
LVGQALFTPQLSKWTENDTFARISFENSSVIERTSKTLLERGTRDDKWWPDLVGWQNEGLSVLSCFAVD